MFKMDFNHRFGQFALALYQQPDVTQSCLSLQDQQRMDVNLLLWARWLDREAVPFDQQLWKTGEARVRCWRLGVIQPLRLLRRSVKRILQGGRIYVLVKHVELWAESIAMRRLSLIAEAVMSEIGGDRSCGSDQPNRDSDYTRHYFQLSGAEAELSTWLSVSADTV
jgi:uncharacterized protein (TIGR02444 family)